MPERSFQSFYISRGSTFLRSEDLCRTVRTKQCIFYITKHNTFAAQDPFIQVCIVDGMNLQEIFRQAAQHMSIRVKEPDSKCLEDTRSSVDGCRAAHGNDNFFHPAIQRMPDQLPCS